MPIILKQNKMENKTKRIYMIRQNNSLKFIIKFKVDQFKTLYTEMGILVL